MKLRLSGHSLRLRLGPSEVARLAEGGRVEEVVEFGPDQGQALRYSIESSTSTPRPIATLEPNSIHIRLPAESAKRWAKSADVGIEAEQSVGADRVLKLLIEKDFECLDAPGVQEQIDVYPHPKRGSPCPPR
jgi:hypothetical protein